MRTGCVAEDQAQANVNEIGRAGVLQRLEQQRVRVQHGRHTEHREPQQHLVTDDQAERRRRTRAEATLSGRGQ
jgi:hypothetical protein